MRAVDAEQAVGGGDLPGRFALGLQDAVSQGSRPVIEPLALGDDPAVERWINAGQAVEQHAVQQLERLRVLQRCLLQRDDVDPAGVRVELHLVTPDRQNMGGERPEAIEQAMQFLPE